MINDERLFNGIINDDSDSWHFLCSTEAFLPLIRYIYERNSMTFNKVSSIPSSVFHTGDKVIKLFCPPEVLTREHDIHEYETELTVMEHARSAGILVPDVMCSGSICDGPYTFNYIIMNYVEGVSAKKVISSYSDIEKKEFAQKLREIKTKLHVPAHGVNIPRFDDPGRINSALWASYPESFREDRKRVIENTVFPELVVCHGDMGRQNIIVDTRGHLYLIDFAESVQAPYYFEDSKLIEDYGCDRVLMKALYGNYENDVFYDMVTTSMLLGWFNGILIEWIAERTGSNKSDISSVTALREILIKWMRCTQY